MKNSIKIIKAKENNLKSVSLEIPKNKLVVFTGVSGSGKSSLAFDTIFAEGQRRYMESLNSYARQFLGNSEKPDVESIENLSPAISIDQKTTSNNPRSTVGTVTEIYDYLRLLYARIGKAYCYNHDIEISAISISQIVDKVCEIAEGRRVYIYAPIVNGQKGSHKELLTRLLKDGFTKVSFNGELYNIEDLTEINPKKKNYIDLLVDRFKSPSERSRIFDSIEIALKNSKQLVKIVVDDQEQLYSTNFGCKLCDFTIPKLEPKLFSFNTPFGSCENCNGLGVILQADFEYLVPNPNLSIEEGGFKYYKTSIQNDNIDYNKFKILAEYYDIDISIPIKDIDKDKLKYLLYGSDQMISYSLNLKSGSILKKTEYIEGIASLIERRYAETNSNMARDYYKAYMSEKTCQKCHGTRLNIAARSVKINQLNIAQFTDFSIDKAIEFINNLELSDKEKEISRLVLKEINDRLSFLNNVGLEYLNLSRLASSLSGGEAQRIRLATQIGSKLSGVLYVLDEPSIGLHQKDNDKLIQTLLSMRDLGNSLIVVEHDEDTMRSADYIVDVGKYAGVDGGEIVFAGSYQEIMQADNSLTAEYLQGKLKIEVPSLRRKGNGKFITIKNATCNNLKQVNVKIPLGMIVGVSGVSGSGKSSLINQVLVNNLLTMIYKSKVTKGECEAIYGVENIDKIIKVSQDPIGRTPRSNPATYTGVFDDIRSLFASTNMAKMKGYDKGRFSFNVKGGRCEACQGDGITKISMHFLPDVYVKCEVCDGKRFNEETLSCTFKDKNIYDVLEMSVKEALVFFENQAIIKNKIQSLYDVGLSYIKLGQNSVTLSGGEAQRVKLASELLKKSTGKTLFVFDEPTTGLHSYDVDKLIKILHRIADNGDTVLVIEHNLDLLKNCDYIIDLGPNGGEKGGEIVAMGSPEQVAEVKDSYTAYYLKKILCKNNVM